MILVLLCHAVTAAIAQSFWAHLLADLGKVLAYRGFVNVVCVPTQLLQICFCHQISSAYAIVTQATSACAVAS